MFRFDHLKRIKPVNVKQKKSKKVLPKDELVGEFIGYGKQFVIRTKYLFEYDEAVACYNEIESDNEMFLEPMIDLKLTKNINKNGNILCYEWKDEVFESKGKGCSKEEIKQFLKAEKFKIKK